MKKSFFSIVAIALVSVIAFSSCKKEKTMTDYLTVEKGWVLTSVVSSVPVELNGGTIIAAGTDLMEGEYANQTGYFYAEDKDDVYKFVLDANATEGDGYQYINYGTKRFEEDPAEDKKMGTFAINEETKVLGLYLPWIGVMENDFYTASIKTLNKDEMELMVNFSVGQANAKLQDGNFTWTIKFAPAK